MEYLLANHDLNIEIEGQALALAFDSCLSAPAVESNLKRLRMIQSLIPGHLLTQT